MTDFLLVRHGETDWNAERRWQGHADPPLNETGREQARALADELAGEHLDAIYSSDLRRAHETAEILAAKLGVPIVTEKALREIDVGDWQGLTRTEIEERFPDGIQRWHETGHGWNGGETSEQLAERVLAAVRRIATEHPEQRVVVVGHGGTVRTIRAFAAGQTIVESRRQSPALGNCEVFRVRAENGTFRGLD